MLKIALFVVGTLVGIVLLMALIGSFFPRDHVASRTRHFAATREVVWGVLHDFVRHPEWRSDVRLVELVPDVGGRPGYREYGRHGAVLYADEVDEAPS